TAGRACSRKKLITMCSIAGSSSTSTAWPTDAAPGSGCSSAGGSDGAATDLDDSPPPAPRSYEVMAPYAAVDPDLRAGSPCAGGIWSGVVHDSMRASG